MIETRNIALLALVASLSLPIPATAQDAAADERPRNVVLFIADGCGFASYTLARTALDRPLVLDPYLVGSISTHSADSRVTDSAAAATALASGHKTNNLVVGLDARGRPVATLLEAAEERGMLTGLVTTTRLTHATPACFAAHVPHRNQAEDIAVQLLEHDIEVLFGGGSMYFLPESEGGARTDGRNLAEEATRRGTTVLRTSGALHRPVDLPVLGLFGRSHLEYEIDRGRSSQPSLAEMTGRALELLAGHEQGFFLMIEAGRIDHAGHNNDPAAHLRDIAAYDAATGRALDFARSHGNTLVLATSDHETGGLSLSRDDDGTPLETWRPEVLVACRASAVAMASRLDDGDDPTSVMSQDARITDLDDDELASLRPGGADSAFRAVCSLLNDRAGLTWSTTGHSAVDVPVFAFGPGARRLGGHRDNTELARELADLMGFDLDELTSRLRAGRTPWLP
jgi:alkaline phosphatase